MLKSTLPSASRDPESLLPIEAEGISVARAGRTLLDVRKILVPGDGAIAVLGHNGCGKTLLLKVLAGLLAPDTGSVTWAGRAPDRTRTLRLGFVLQRPVLLRRSVIANVMYPLQLAGLGRQEQWSRAMAKLRHWRLDHLADTPARVLSGGEQRRVAIARALVMKPECLFLDEPAANLDPEATRAIEGMIGAAKLAAIPVVLVTHDLGQARRLADEIVFMDHGKIVEQAPADRFFKAPESREAKAFLNGDI